MKGFTGGWAKFWKVGVSKRVWSNINRGWLDLSAYYGQIFDEISGSSRGPKKSQNGSKMRFSGV